MILTLSADGAPHPDEGHAMTTYTVGGQQINVRQEGPLDAPVAVLIHGWCSSWYTWKPLLPALSKRFRCLAIDLPGFGASPAAPDAPTIGRYAELVAELITQVSDRSVLLMGHSMGGMISMEVALRHRPLVERMVLLNPTVSGHLSTFINLFISPLIMLERAPLGGRLVGLLERTPLGYGYTDRVLGPISFAERAMISSADYSRIRADARRPGQGRVRAACFTAMRSSDLRGRLAALEPPALVLWGAEDNTVPLRDAGSVAAEWPKADLRLIPNAGHWPQFEQFEITLRHVSAFLGLPTIPGLPDDVDGDNDPETLSEVAQSIAGSDLGYELSDAQRSRLAAQFRVRNVKPGASIASQNTHGDELYLLREGTVEVWSSASPEGGAASSGARKLATISAGQVVGEMALLDNQPRSADLRAGPQGATMLVLKRQRFDGLCEEDPQLGQQVLRNLARALALRVRHQNWQLQFGERRGEPGTRGQRAA
jgi:pimeloyl-ACP methyl ester carboxylesterase/CRP-like cAMP-binding protein